MDCLDAVEGALEDKRTIDDPDPFAGVGPGQDPWEESDYDSAEEDDAWLFRTLEQSLATCDSDVWSTFGLKERAQALQDQLSEQCSVREERTASWNGAMRPEPDYDDMREAGRSSEPSSEFSVDAVFRDL